MLEGSANEIFSTLTKWVEKGGERGDKTFSTTTPYRVGGGGGGGSPQGGGGEPTQTAAELLLRGLDADAGRPCISRLLGRRAIAQRRSYGGRGHVDRAGSLVAEIPHAVRVGSDARMEVVREALVDPIPQHVGRGAVVAGEILRCLTRSCASTRAIRRNMQLMVFPGSRSSRHEFGELRNQSFDAIHRTSHAEQRISPHQNLRSTRSQAQSSEVLL